MQDMGMFWGMMCLGVGGLLCEVELVQCYCGQDCLVQGGWLFEIDGEGEQQGQSQGGGQMDENV